MKQLPMSSTANVPLAAWCGVDKHFEGLHAVKGVELDLRAGEILALVGENGAGKTTLVNLLYGLLQPNAGYMEVRGKPHCPAHPAQAMAAGLGMVHQHFTLFDEMTVLENVVFGAEPVRRGGFMDHVTARRRLEELSTRYGLGVDPDVLAGDLPVGVRQRVEILKMLFRNAAILIMDEPTAVLTPQERDGLFRFFNTLRASGHAIIFITHKLNEVTEMADRVAVMRDGALVGTDAVAATTVAKIANLMVGRNLDLRRLAARKPPGETQLEVRDLAVAGRPGMTALQPVSFSVAAGEIVGVAGVAQNGQEALVASLGGLVPATAGTVRIAGADLTFARMAARRAAGMAFVPADRHHAGLALDATLVDNSCAGRHHLPPLSKRGWLQPEQMVARARKHIAEYDIRGVSPSGLARSLSGGNQQKLVLSRELGQGARVLVVDQPTWGVDVGAIEFIYRQLDEARAAGCAILLVSADLNEIMQLSDRVLVLHDGALAATVTGAGVTDEYVLGQLMAGLGGLAKMAS